MTTNQRSRDKIVHKLCSQWSSSKQCHNKAFFINWAINTSLWNSSQILSALNEFCTDVGAYSIWVRIPWELLRVQAFYNPNFSKAGSMYIVKQKRRHGALLPRHRRAELCHSLRAHLHWVSVWSSQDYHSPQLSLELAMLMGSPMLC